MDDVAIMMKFSDVNIIREPNIQVCQNEGLPAAGTAAAIDSQDIGTSRWQLKANFTLFLDTNEAGYADDRLRPVTTQIKIRSPAAYREPSRIVANRPNPTLAARKRHSARRRPRLWDRLCIAHVQA